MADKINQLDQAPVDVFEAIKRAMMKQGFVRRHGVSADNNAITPDRTESANRMTKQATLKPEGVVVEKPDEDPEILVSLAQNSQETLIESSTVFPFTLIPGTISIDREKLTIAKRTFFRVASINSVPITDIQSVEVDVGPFFGTVRVTSKYFVNNRRQINFLWRDDATKIQHLLQGLIVAHQRNVDINTLDKEQLLMLLSDLGQGIAD